MHLDSIREGSDNVLRMSGFSDGQGEGLNKADGDDQQSLSRRRRALSAGFFYAYTRAALLD